jgi:CheY-like chemotaxis protein
MSKTPLRILIVDDNSAARGALRTLMEVHGRQVRTVATGPEALAAAEEFHPQVVLLDLALPGMSGYEVAEKLRGRPGLEKLRIIAVTGHAQPLNVVWSQQTGFDLHLVKPVDPEDLERALEGPIPEPAH